MLVKSLKKRLAKDGIKSSKTIEKILVINGKNQKPKSLKNF